MIASLTKWLQRPRKVSRERQLLDEFSRELDLVEKQVPMLGGYQRLDPYLRECNQGGISYQLIIYHAESKAWFDNENTDQVLLNASENGLVNVGDTVFDLGCNSGFLTAWFALRVGAAGSVHAFDPFPWNTLSTRYTALINGCNNVKCHTLGVAAKHGSVRIPFVDSKIYANQHVEDSLCFEAKLVPLDEFASARPDFIKVDIEGAERELLAGCGKLLKQTPKPHWLFEIHHEFIRAAGCDPNQIGIDLVKAGYSCPIGNVTIGARFEKTLNIPDHAAIFGLATERLSAARSAA